VHPLPQGLKDCRQALFCRGRPAVGAGLDETTAESHTAHKWLDGVSDALTDFLRRLRETYPCATAKIRPGPTPTADYRPSRRSPWPAAQENVIAQLKNGVNAMRMPVDDLDSNWAYMVMAALAWNLKAWFGLLMPNRIRRSQVLKMEFRRFLHTFILIPCQIVRTGRKIVYRLLAYNESLKDFFDTFERIKRLQFQ